MAAFLAVSGLGLIVVLLLLLGTRKRPPTISVASIEPAGVFDDNGEMSLVTLGLKDTDYSGRPEGALCLRSPAHPIEARVKDRWVRVDGRLDWRGGRGGVRECDLLLPAGANACRFTVEYTGATRVFRKHPIKGPILWVVEQLPLSVRRRFSYKFWRWAGFPEYGPGTGWRRISFEVPFAPLSGAPSTAAPGAHNPQPPLDAAKSLREQVGLHWRGAGKVGCSVIYRGGYG